MKYTAVILAAGKGSRTQLDYNKVFYHLTPEQTVLDASIQLFSDDPDCSQIIAVCAPYELEYMHNQYQCRYPKMELTTGGKTRQDSVWNGLMKVKEDIVLIHDGARPYVKQKNVDDLKRALMEDQAALLMTPSTDTIKTVDEDGYVVETLPRQQVYNAQTPQGFHTKTIAEAHKKARKMGFQGTDDAQIVEKFGDCPVACVIGDPSNTKITNPSDLKPLLSNS